MFLHYNRRTEKKVVAGGRQTLQSRCTTVGDRVDRAKTEEPY